MTVLCACGCGKATSVITKSNAHYGHVAGEYRKYISGHANRNPEPTIEDLKSQTVTDDSGCWSWVGKVQATGYGYIVRNRKKEGVHRVMYTLVHGEIPSGLQVRHKCDNRRCCNPEHLEIGTIADNMRDKALRGRASRGENHHSAKLTKDEVLQIRASSDSVASLAKQFAVTERAITFILSRRNWKHV